MPFMVVATGGIRAKMPKVAMASKCGLKPIQSDHSESSLGSSWFSEEKQSKSDFVFIDSNIEVIHITDQKAMNDTVISMSKSE